MESDDPNTTSRMSSDKPNFDMDQFREWLSRAAASREASEEEVLYQMMSSYWILDELTELIEETDGEEGSIPFASGSDRESRSDTPESTAPSESEESAGDGSTSTLDPALIELVKELNASRDPSPQPPASEKDGYPDLIGLINALKDFGRSDPTHTDRTQAGLHDDIESLERTVDALAEDVAGLDDRVDTIDDRVESVDDRSSREVAEVQDRVDGLQQELDAVGARIERKASQDAVNSLSERVDESESALSERLDGVESQVDDGLDKVRTILAHLFEQIDDLEGDTAALFEAYEELQPLLAEYNDRQRLADLKAEANREGVGEADCGFCDNPVDIGLLERPNCPHCDRPFKDLRVDSGWLRTSKVLTTGEFRSDGDSTGEGMVDENVLPTLSDRLAEREDPPSDGGSPDESGQRHGRDKGESGGFEWTDE